MPRAREEVGVDERERLGEEVVDHPPDRQRQAEGEAGGDGQRRERPPEQRPVGTDEGPEPAQRADRPRLRALRRTDLMRHRAFPELSPPGLASAFRRDKPRVRRGAPAKVERGPRAVRSPLAPLRRGRKETGVGPFCTPEARGHGAYRGLPADSTIYGPGDEKIGSVAHLHGSGAGAQVIVDVGGFLGIGAKPVALPVSQLHFMRDEDGEVHATTTLTKEAGQGLAGASSLAGQGRILPPRRGEDGAGDGNRTHVFSLEGCCSTIELHPRAPLIGKLRRAVQAASVRTGSRRRARRRGCGSRRRCSPPRSWS